jgi:hypothetical protein
MKTTTIMLDKERTLKFGVRAFIAMEKALGKPLAKFDYEQTETIYVMLYGGLVHEDKSLTVDKVIDIVEAMIDKEVEEGKPFQEAFKDVLTAIGERVMTAMGNKDGLNAMPKE